MPTLRIETLPAELRNAIYTNVSLSDKITLMRVSRSTNQDVSPLFYKEATWTIVVKVRYPFMRIGCFSIQPPPPHIKDKIQNLDVYWEPFEPKEVAESDIAVLNWDPPIRRALCRVFYKWIPAELGLLNPFTDRDLMTFAGFETVEIRVRLKPQERPLIDHVPVTESGYKPTVSEPLCSDTCVQTISERAEICVWGCRADTKPAGSWFEIPAAQTPGENY